MPDSEREGERKRGLRLLCERDEGSQERKEQKVLAARLTTREKRKWGQHCALTVGSVATTRRDAGRSETGSLKLETDQVPESELSLVPEDDDLSAAVIVVMTDVEVLLDGSSVIDVFPVNSARRKRLEVGEKKLTENDRKLFRKAKELALQSWLDHRVFDLV